MKIWVSIISLIFNHHSWYKWIVKVTHNWRINFTFHTENTSFSVLFWDWDTIIYPIFIKCIEIVEKYALVVKSIENMNTINNNKNSKV